jgi:hypothetical protein
VLPGSFEGERQNLVVAGLLWAAAGTIYWRGAGGLAETGDLAVGAVFAALALYHFARAAFADSSSLRAQKTSCHWSWGWWALYSAFRSISPGSTRKCLRNGSQTR